MRQPVVTPCSHRCCGFPKGLGHGRRPGIGCCGQHRPARSEHGRRASRHGQTLRGRRRVAGSDGSADPGSLRLHRLRRQAHPSRWRGGLADDQGRVIHHQPWHTGRRRVAYEFDREPDSFGDDLAGRHTQSSQGRNGVSRIHEVVKPDDGEVIRDDPAQVVRGMQSANRREVGRADDSGRWLGQTQEGSQCRLPTRQRVGTTFNLA